MDRLILFCAFLLAVGARDCSIGGESLCSCSELLAKHLIPSMDDCTQAAAATACKSGDCAHDEVSIVSNSSLPVRALDCTVGGDSLCSCSELLAKHLIRSVNDCTQEAAVKACKSGDCANDLVGIANNSTLASLMKLRYSYHNDLGPFDMSWDFPTSDTIEIEFVLPSEYYIGIGFTSNGVGDAVAAWVDNGKVHIGDYWDQGSREPDTDESKHCHNDIEPVSGHSQDGFTTARFRRKLDTGDKGDCDAKIVRGPMEINYAWCDSPWCADSNGKCKGYGDGCLDSPHSADASNMVTVDFSGNGFHMLSTDITV